MSSYLKTKDYFNTQEEFELLYDSELDMLVTHPQPSELDIYYKSEDYISHSDSRQNLLEKIYHLVKKYNLNRKVRLIDSVNSPGKKLLDIGAGTGDFLLTAKNKNWNIEGVEPNSMARSKAAGKGILLHPSIDDIPKTKFDVITLWHVLEHLPNLDKQLASITSLLNDNGNLIVAVPNFKSYDAKRYKTFWAGFDVPRHLWHFSRTAIPLLFNKYNLDLMSTKPMCFDSYYVSLLSEKYKTGKTKLLSAAYTGFISNIRALSTKEYSSIIYILKKA
ncbi:class I SAM-dependent methyltransferase [Maribacter aestuarii]|uniref:class I SAM-dependent methyltransferase n=1 Tax=Maribacter aestuarii TaxID=1130723 RepID=UPI00248C2B7C|nr:class I SAM-dependent methyltransferase [Maribacter aestuarii]